MAERNPNLTWRENVAMTISPDSLASGMAALSRLEGAGYRVLNATAVPQVDALEYTRSILSGVRSEIAELSGNMAHQAENSVKLLNTLLNASCAILAIDRDALAASQEVDAS